MNYGWFLDYYEELYEEQSKNKQELQWLMDDHQIDYARNYEMGEAWQREYNLKKEEEKYFSTPGFSHDHF